MEDDTDIVNISKWPISYKMVTENAPMDWEIIQMFTSNTNVLKDIFHRNSFTTGHLSSAMYINRGVGRDTFFSTGCYIINRIGMEKILSECYDMSINAFKLVGEIAIADYFIYDKAKSYFYIVPTVSTRDTEFQSLIIYKQNHLGLSASNMINGHYKNKSIVCLLK